MHRIPVDGVIKTYKKCLPGELDLSQRKEANHSPREPRSMAAYKRAEFLIDSRYELRSLLGQGSYGTVCSAIDLNSKKKSPIAIKKVSKIFTKEVLLRRALRELKLMALFKGHKNIINLIDLDLVCQEPYDGLYCFQELLEHDLSNVIIGSAQLSNLTIQSFIYQICCGVKYIHSADVIHRDLKPNNILVTSQGTLKICDFGLARGINEQWMDHKRSRQITSYVATRWYRAPELILTRKLYGKEVDMWSVGCIIGELYGRKPLFIGEDSTKQILEICKVLGLPDKELIYCYGSNTAFSFFHEQPAFVKKDWGNLYPLMPLNCQSLIDGLLCWDAEIRLTVEQVLEYPFLASIKNPDEEVSCREVFNFEFEQKYQTMYELKMLLLEEVKNFRAQKEMIQTTKEMNV